jgi:hypothetical protein
MHPYTVDMLEQLTSCDTMAQLETLFDTERRQLGSSINAGGENTQELRDLLSRLSVKKKSP